jgi:homocysteine S-methyltransferase
MTGFEAALASHDLILAGGSMYERLRRHDSVDYDPHIAHAGLIYDDAHREVIAGVHREYIDVARRARMPMLVGAATWRATPDRIARSGFPDRRVNQDNVGFIRELCAKAATATTPLFVAGMMGPRGDAYRPDDALPDDDAARFHTEQAEALAQAGPDVIIAMTLPALSEARGLRRALEATGLPYMLSFVVRDSGTLLDGTPLAEAFDRLDQESARAPIGYYVNCVHPAILERGLADADASVAARIMGFKGNTADKSPEELDASAELISEDPATFGERVARVKRAFDITIIGGCCGTGTEHIEQIAARCATSSD